MQPVNPRLPMSPRGLGGREFTPESLGITSMYGCVVQGPIGMLWQEQPKKQNKNNTNRTNIEFLSKIITRVKYVLGEGTIS